jgi:DNA-binding PadR family transcriptional regulator
MQGVYCTGRGATQATVDSRAHIAYIAGIGVVNLGEFEQVVLLAVLRVGDDAYAIPVREEIRLRARRDVARGALYTALERLEEKGLLSSHMSEPRPERGGRARRYFTVTGRGLSALRSSRRAMLDLWRGLETTLEKP